MDFDSLINPENEFIGTSARTVDGFRVCGTEKCGCFLMAREWRLDEEYRVYYCPVCDVPVDAIDVMTKMFLKTLPRYDNPVDRANFVKEVDKNARDKRIENDPDIIIFFNQIDRYRNEPWLRP